MADAAVNGNIVAMNSNDATVTSLAGDRFVVVWVNNSDIFDGDISAQIFSSTGEKIGSEFRVSTGGSMPTASSLTNGNFVVTWFDGDDIKAHLFSASGEKLGSEFLVNTNMADAQLYPQVSVSVRGL